MKPKAVLYLRVSTKEQAHNLSLPTQLKACRDYCQREGLEVIRIFEDAGASAKTVDRPEFQNLIRFCQASKGNVHKVVVYNLSRFSRNSHDHLTTRVLLAK